MNTRVLIPKLPTITRFLSCFLLFHVTVQAGVIQQATGSSYVAFEATTATVIPGTQENWTVKAVPNATHGTALYADGTTDVNNAPHSFAHYQIQFRTAGSYYLYYRWKADEARTGGENATANSSRHGRTWGAYSTPDDESTYVRSDSNNTTAPANNTFAWRMEPATTWMVDAAELAAPVTFTVGTREAGMVLDQLVFSTDPALTPIQLDTLTFELATISQGSGEDFVAFQAEGPVFLITGTPESWAASNDATAVNGSALYASGTTDVNTAPHSFAWYQLNFRTEGTYYIYYRWKADAARTGGDNATANSAWLSSTWGALSTPDDEAPYTRTDSNNTTAPANNTFAWRMEPALVYGVSAVELNTPVFLTLGTREAGMVLDRFILSTQSALTPAQLDALVDSGTEAPAPEITSAVGREGLNGVTVNFSRPLATSSVQDTDFVFAPTLAISSIAIDPDDARIVRVTTAAQPPGTAYTLTVAGVTDTAGTPIKPGASQIFTSWKPVNGWAKMEMYNEIPESFVFDLSTSPKYPDKPDKVQFVRDFRLPRSGEFVNMGVRLSAWFHPPSNDAFDLFVNNDDEAEILLSTDDTEAGLNSLGLLFLHPPPFADGYSVQTPSLSSSQKYLLRGVLKQGTGEYYLEVAARPAGATEPAAESLTALSGNQISTMINPDLGVVTFDSEPPDVTATAGGRARFVANVSALSTPVYFQWRRDGVDIPGATRPTYVTPVLTSADNNKKYDVVVSVAGISTTSRQATLTVNPGEPPNLQPYIGVNFIGAGYVVDDAVSLAPYDVAGVVPQENWNNLPLPTGEPVSLSDAQGAATPVQLTITTPSGTGLQMWSSGTRSLRDADGDLMQGFLNNGGNGTNGEPVFLTLTGVPGTNYQLIVYTTGFDFAANYEERFVVTGAVVYPTIHGKAETGLNYVNNPAYRRITSTTTESRQTGNYVQYDNVSPAPDGALGLEIQWEAPFGGAYNPAINGFQLVRVLPSTGRPSLTATVEPGNLVLGWGADAAGFTLQSTASVGTASNWSAVTGVANPLTGAGSVNIQTATGTQFYRLAR